MLREYEFHPEAKCADSSGAPCSKQTIGLLGRRHVAIDSITYIGKESNRLEEVEEQSLLDPERRVHRVPRSAARRVGDEDSAQAQGHAAARAHGADRAAAIDASGDTGRAQATSTDSQPTYGTSAIKPKPHQKFTVKD